MSWQQKPLIELTEKIGSGSTPRGGDSVYVNSGTALIRSQNIYNSEFTSNGLVFMDDSMADKMKGVSVFENDVLLNITGDSVARCCLADCNFLPARVNQHVAIIRTKKELLNPDFLMFFLVSPYMQAKMLSWAGTGGTRKALTKGMIEGFEVPVPPIDVQKSIVKILKTYTLLIENNRRRIQLLEESARLLYREWFVHLRFPSHEHSKIVDGVHEGWNRTTVSELGKVITGKTPSTKDSNNFGTSVPFIKTPDMHASSIILFTEEYLSEKGASLQKNKTLPPNSILVACIGAKLGVVSLNGLESQTNQQINAVVPAKENLTYYSYLTLKEFREKLLAIGGGATMPNVNKSKFETMSVIIPSDNLLDSFHETVKQNFEQMKTLISMNKKLESARDLLLPRLMNGEITV